MLSRLGLYLPEASIHAEHVDELMLAFSALALVLTGPVFILIVAFAIRYRRGKAVNREHSPDRKVWLEISWSVIPTILILIFFIAAARMFFTFHRRPANAIQIDAVAKQWMWKFQHPGGQREINQLHVPIGQPVAISMISQDVIHSLYIPALRIKQDVLPGRYTNLYFTADRPGTYRLHCAEYCGADHARMGGVFVAMTTNDYARWLQSTDRALTPAGEGEKLYAELGCGVCHDKAGAVPAPPLKGLYGRAVRMADGGSVRADEQYLRQSIMDPNAAVVAGYAPAMPSYRKLIDEEQAAALVAYLRSRRP